TRAAVSLLPNDAAVTRQLHQEQVGRRAEGVRRPGDHVTAVARFDDRPGVVLGAWSVIALLPADCAVGIELEHPHVVGERAASPDPAVPDQDGASVSRGAERSQTLFLAGVVALLPGDAAVEIE